MAHLQYHLRTLQIEFSCKIFRSGLHLDWVIMLTNKSGRLATVMPLTSMKMLANIHVAQIQYIICEYVILPATLYVPWIWFNILTQWPVGEVVVNLKV